LGLPISSLYRWEREDGEWRHIRGEEEGFDV
jgi:hypothetical protein